MELDFIGMGERIRTAHQWLTNQPSQGNGAEELIGQIQKAHDDWLAAENRFNQFTEPHLVDCSIYEMMAAKSKYQYLLQCAKEENLRL